MKFTPGGAGQQPPMQMNINPDDCETYVCEKCGNDLFMQLFGFKKLSALQSPYGKEALMPVQVAYSCTDCGYTAEEIGGMVLTKYREAGNEKEEPESDNQE